MREEGKGCRRDTLKEFRGNYLVSEAAGAGIQSSFS